MKEFLQGFSKTDQERLQNNQGLYLLVQAVIASPDVKKPEFKKILEQFLASDYSDNESLAA